MSKIKRTFISKSILAIRDLLKDPDVEIKNKYFCLQIVNICMLMEKEIFIDFFCKKLLDKLYSFACHDKNSEDEEANGETIFKELEDINDIEHSKKFYFLLLEMFGYWGTNSYFKSFQKIYSKYKVLKNSALKFPRENEYIFEYSHYFKKYLPNVEKSTSFEDNTNNIEELLTGTNDALDFINEYFENNNSTDDYFDELIQNYLKNFKELNELRNKMNYKQKKKFSELEDFTDIYLENKNNFLKLKRVFKNYKKQSNPFLKKNDQDLSEENQKLKNEQYNDVISNDSINFNKKKAKENNVKNNPEKGDEIIKNYLEKERGDLLTKVSNLERALADIKKQKDKINTKLSESNIKNERLENLVQNLTKENKNKTNQIENFTRDIKKHLNIKSKNIYSSSIQKNYPKNIENDFKNNFHKTTTDSYQRKKNVSLLGNMPLTQTNAYYGNKYGGDGEEKKPNQNRQNRSFTDMGQFKGRNSYYNGDIKSFKSKMMDDKNFMENINSSINKILKRDKRTSNKQDVREGRSNSMMGSKFNIYEKKENSALNPVLNPYSMKMSTNLRFGDKGVSGKDKKRFGSSMMDDYLKKYSGNRNSFSSKDNMEGDRGNTSGGIFKYKNI